MSVFFSINFTDSHDCCMFTSTFEALKASRVYSNYSSCAGDFSHPLFTLAQPHFLPTAAAHFIDFREYAPETPYDTFSRLESPHSANSKNLQFAPANFSLTSAAGHFVKMGLSEGFQLPLPGILLKWTSARVLLFMRPILANYLSKTAHILGDTAI